MSQESNDRGSWPTDEIPSTWEWIPFKEFLLDLTSSDKKLPQKHYLHAGAFPVIDQGQDPIGGFTNEESLSYSGPLPVIVFGDHTRCIKFVSAPFVQGADGVKVLVPSQAVDPRFAFWALSTIRLPDKGYSRHFKFLKDSRFPIAPFLEQRRIVSKLESLQAHSRRAKEALDAIPALLERFRQSVLAAAFRGDLTADWRAQHPDVEPASKLLERIRAERRRLWEEAELEKMRVRGKPPQNDSWKAKYQESAEALDTSGLPHLPDGWCWVDLGSLLQQIEAGHSPKALGRPALPHEAGVLKVSAVSWGQFLPEENKALPPDQSLDTSATIKAGDLLISRANTAELVGAVVLTRESHPNLMLSDKTLRLVPFAAEISKEYLLYSLRTSWVRKVFEEDATGTSDSMRNLSQDKIRLAPIALAPLKEQHEIARRIGVAMSKYTAILNQQSGATDKLAQLEQALLAKAFRGELVPQDPNDEPASVLLERLRAEREASDGSTPKRSRGRRPAA